MFNVSMINIDRIWFVTGCVLVVLTTFFSLIPLQSQLMDFKLSDKIEHLIVYMLLMLWFVQITRKGSYMWLAMGFISMGVVLEIMQGLTSYRRFDYSDILANTNGVLIGWIMTKTRMANILNVFKKRLGLPGAI